MKQQILLFTAIVLAGLTFSANAQNLPSYVPAVGLIAWWPMNGNTNDISGNNNNGTNVGATLTTDRFGRADSAYSFDGISSHIEIPSSASLESPSSELTMTAWVNIAGFSLVGFSFDPVLNKTNSGGNAFMYRLVVNTLNDFYAGTNNWNSNVGAPYTFQLNQWYLIGAVLDSDSAYFYVNDSLISSQPYTTNITSNALPLEIGMDSPGATEIFNGKIDDIGIWSKALTHQQITTLYDTSSVTSGISEEGISNQLFLYPNPASGSFTVKNTSLQEKTLIEISTLLGDIVYSENHFGMNNYTIDAHLAKGLYFVRINNAVRKLVVE